MNYTIELKKFITGQNIALGVRIALAIIVPSIILAYFGLLKEYFLFPLSTSFMGFIDMPGPLHRRRNTFLLAAFCFTITLSIASLLTGYLVLVYLELLIFGMFFTIIGVYGQRFAAIGSLSLVILSIFIEGDIVSGNLLKDMAVFFAGCVWFILISVLITTIRPYKLAEQMIGENYILLSDFLKIKAKFYKKNPDYKTLTDELLSVQVKLKNLQEETRDTVFRTRVFIKEATPTSRTLLLMFLNAIDLHEKLLTSENDYSKIQKKFGEGDVLLFIHQYLLKLAHELSVLGISLQSGRKVELSLDLEQELNEVFDHYFQYRNRYLSSENLEDFLILRQILQRIKEVTEEIISVFLINSKSKIKEIKNTKNLDLKSFLSKEQDLNLNVIKNNLSFDSAIFKHGIRVTLALLLGFSISQLTFLGVGHSYWILITILAILRPSFSLTKSRNLLRLFGTVTGAVLAYLMLLLIKNDTVLLGILFLSILLCFSFVKEKYYWAVLFMTIYIFITFNFLKPGNINIIFKDRVLDTVIAGIISFIVSYFIFPNWEYKQSLPLIKKVSKSSFEYIETILDELLYAQSHPQKYRLKRKEVIIDQSNLAANFQRMISEPKKHQKILEWTHQFVTTSHLMISYTASLSQYAEQNERYLEIDFNAWKGKILGELSLVQDYLKKKETKQEIEKINLDDQVDLLLKNRKSEIDDNLFYDRRDTQNISRLTTLKNITEILELILDVAKEQKKIAYDYSKD